MLGRVLAYPIRGPEAWAWSVSQAPLQQGAQQLLVVLHEPKEAAALARAIKQEARVERAPAAPAEFISEFTLVYRVARP